MRRNVIWTLREGCDACANSAKSSAAGFALGAAIGFSALAAQADDAIRILCPTWPGYAPIFVANDLGYFKDEGITVTMNFDDDRSDVLAAMARGDIEIDMRTVGEHQGSPRDENTPGIIIGTIDELLGGDGVIVDETIKSVADMKGKTVAVEPNIPARLLLQLELKKAGLTLKDVDLRQIATADTVAVFADPSVPVVATYEPFMSQAVKNLPDRHGRILDLVEGLSRHHHRHHRGAERRPQGQSGEVQEVPARRVQGGRLLQEPTRPISSSSPRRTSI